MGQLEKEAGGITCVNQGSHPARPLPHPLHQCCLALCPPVLPRRHEELACFSHLYLFLWRVCVRVPNPLPAATMDPGRSASDVSDWRECYEYENVCYSSLDGAF